MTITISLPLAVIVLIIVHTVFSHMLNWWLREASDSDEEVIFAILVTMIEFAFVLIFAGFLTS